MGKYTYFGYRIDTNAKVREPHPASIPHVCSQVTIKIIEKKNPALEALRIEYTLLRNISHPHVLQVYDILEDDQNVYFVMVRPFVVAPSLSLDRSMHHVGGLFMRLEAAVLCKNVRSKP